MIQLPPYDRENIEQQPVYDYNITLSGVEYRIVLRYRERNDRWYLTIYDADDVVMLSNRKLSIDTPVLVDLQITGLPPGEIMLIDTSWAEAECGYEDLGTRCWLVYFELADIPAESTDYGITIEAVP